MGLEVTTSPRRLRRSSGTVTPPRPTRPRRTPRGRRGARHRVDEKVDGRTGDLPGEAGADAGLVHLAGGDGLQTGQHTGAVTGAVRRVPVDGVQRGPVGRDPVGNRCAGGFRTTTVRGILSQHAVRPAARALQVPAVPVRVGQVNQPPPITSPEPVGASSTSAGVIGSIASGR